MKGTTVGKAALIDLYRKWRAAAPGARNSSTPAWGRTRAPVALGFAVASFPILLSSSRISRTEGVTMVLLYLAYLVFLVR